MWQYAPFLQLAPPVASRGALKIATLGEIAFKRAKTPDFHLKNVCGGDQLPKNEKQGEAGVRGWTTVGEVRSCEYKKGVEISALPKKGAVTQQL